MTRLGRVRACDTRYHRTFCMASSRHLTTLYPSSDFTIAAGSCLFRRSESEKLQICLLYDRKRKEWRLPKGRKDCGEHIEATTIRETFEETGYPCELLPIRMTTRAPQVGINTCDIPKVVDGVTEPFALTISEREQGFVKTIWWFVTRVMGEKVEGVQTDSEAYDSKFFDAEDAVGQLTFQAERNIVSLAIAAIHAQAQDWEHLFPL